MPEYLITIIVVTLFLILLYLYCRGVWYSDKVDRYERKHRAEKLGEAGENAVYARLSRLPEEFDVFNNVVFQYRDRSTQIDHIVVSPYGLYVIETKNMAGPIYGSENNEFWSEYLPETRYRNKEYRFRNPIWQNDGHIKALRAVLQDNVVPIYGIIVFPKGTELNVNTTRKVTTWDQLYHTIVRYDEVVMDSDTVAKYSALIGEANVTDPDARQSHVAKARQNKVRRNEMVADGKCPRCGSPLVQREGGFGRFWGCSNYPKCKYILK